MDEVVQTMKQNVTIAKAVIQGALPLIAAHQGEHPLAHTLKGAIMTHADAIPDRIRFDLAPILGKYLGVPANYVAEERAHKQHQFHAHDEHAHEEQSSCKSACHPCVYHHVLLAALGVVALWHLKSRFW